MTESPPRTPLFSAGRMQVRNGTQETGSLDEWSSFSMVTNMASYDEEDSSVSRWWGVWKKQVTSLTVLKMRREEDPQWKFRFHQRWCGAGSGQKLPSFSTLAIVFSLCLFLKSTVCCRLSFWSAFAHSVQGSGLIGTPDTWTMFTRKDILLAAHNLDLGALTNAVKRGDDPFDQDGSRRDVFDYLIQSRSVVGDSGFKHNTRHIQCFKMLLEHGVDVCRTDKSGWTLLHRAAWCGDLPVAQLLLRHGAESTLHDSQGRTASDLAAIKVCPSFRGKTTAPCILYSM